MPGQFDFELGFTFEGEPLHIRPITEQDIETLRQWKNHNREFFSHQEIITPEQQSNWFARFSQDPGEALYLLEKDGRAVACVGYRYSKLTEQPHGAELFNLMCGEESLAGRGLMREFFTATAQALKERGFERIELKVLNTNTKAQAWYRRQGFQETGSDADLTYLRYDL